MADLQLLLEAEKRGLLPPDRLALLDEARKRGLVPPKMDFQGMQREALSRDQIRQQIDSDPISTRARAASKETVLPRWLAGNPDATYAQRVAAAPATRFAVGAAAPFLGAVQLAHNAVADGANAFSGALGGPTNVPRSPLNDSLQGFEQMKQAGGATGFDAMGLAGTVMSPAALAALRLAPSATVAGRAGQGAAIGGGFGASTPVTNGAEDFWSDKAGQTGAGIALGGAIPLGVDAVRGAATVARNVVDPWLPGGVTRTVGRTLNEAAGSNRPALVSALRNPQQIVPGSLPTAGEAGAGVGSAEFAGLQEVIKGRAPST
jgi:hypothetical protein